MIDGTFTEIGIGGLFALSVLKTILPYMKPAKTNNNGLCRELAEVFKPIHDRQVTLLEKMNERDIITHLKVLSSHEDLKEVNNMVRDNGQCLAALHKRFDGFDRPRGG